MTRTYKAHSQIAFTVVFNGKQRYIQFVPLSIQGSYFVTDDKELASVLESSSLYGKAFFKDEERCEDDVYARDVSSMDELIEDAASDSSSEEPKEFVDVEEITNLPDAQQYLVDKGVAKRYINSKVKVLRKAEQLGIRFPNLS
jgi:hypothetical protein